MQKEYESDSVLAFHHTRPLYPVHIVVIPKRHISSLLSLTPDDNAIFLEMFDVIKSIASTVEKEHGAARVLTNIGNYQDSKHLHFHIHSGEPLIK